MKTIARRTPKSSITLHKALFKGAMVENNLPAAQRFLPPAFSTKLINTSTDYNNLVRAASTAEANYGSNNSDLRKSVGKLRTYCNHFIQVLNFAIVRGDEGFSEGDRHYYSLTDGKVPNLVSEDNVFFWAENLLNGEANRLAAKPGAPAMSNPSATKLAALKATADDLLVQENQLATIQSLARAQVNKAFKNGVMVVTQLWNFVENNYLQLPDSARRDMMREWGVVFITIGTPTQLSGLVKNEAGEPLPGCGDAGRNRCRNQNQRGWAIYPAHQLQRQR